MSLLSETSLSEMFREYGFSLNSEQVRDFSRLLELFMEYNSHTNLSGIREPEAIVQKHFIDSLFLTKCLDLSNLRILDIGTGGGFPGIPLKIMVPSTEAVLLDSIWKKIKACQHFIDELKLENISAVQARAEQLSATLRPEALFDVVTSRATALLPIILEWALPFIKPSGKIVLYKTPSPDEMSAGLYFARRNGLFLQNTFSYDLAGQSREILFFGKSRQ